jgi:prepilin-type N-terminal cleavage/methylation domain-containing protein
MKKNAGFTLVEILVVMVIAVLIYTLGSIAYRNWQKQVQISNSADELRSTLFRAQQMAAASAESTAWGVHLETDRYILFSGDFYNVSDPNNKEKILQGTQIFEPESSFADGVGGYSSDVVFAKLTGQTVNTGTVSIITLVQPSNTSTVSINSSGQIDRP